MPGDLDMAAYLGIFLDEAEEQLQVLDETLILLEQHQHDGELLNKIFRAAHTLKGSSASMGFEKMASVTHNMESILDELRQGKLVLSSAIIDSLLSSLDVLRRLREEIAQQGGEGDVDIEGVLDKLDRVRSSAAVPGSAPPAASPGIASLNDIEENLVRAAEIKGYHVWQVKVMLEPDCLMKGPRAYIVFKNLEEVGEVIKAVPPVEDIEAEKFDLSFELLLVSKEDADRITNIIKSTSEIAAVEISALTLDEGADAFASLVAAAGPMAPTVTAGETVRMPNAAASEEKKAGQTVRVDVHRLDNLLNLVGELVIDRTRLARVGGELRGRLGAEELVETMEEISVHIGRITGELQGEIMKARMFPIDQVFNRFPRMVRDLAHKAGKQVNFIIEGRETELDRTVIEEIGDPLIHLLRNAIDHGVELPEERLKQGKPPQGTVELKAYQQENQIVITVTDDGRGMDPEALRRKAVERGLIKAEQAGRMSDREAFNLIFLPGFSTSETVSDVSGRGVGMDIVRNHLEKINGVVEIQTAKGRGTKFTIKLPLTLAINRSLLVYAAGQVMAFPLVNVVEIISVDPASIQQVHQQDVVLVRGEVLPLVDLAAALGFSSMRASKESLAVKDGLSAEENMSGTRSFSVVIVAISERRVGFIVDDLIGEQEVVIKSLGEYVGQVPGLAGATIMGDGKVALILDVRGLVLRSTSEATTRLLAS